MLCFSACCGSQLQPYLALVAPRLGGVSSDASSCKRGGTPLCPIVAVLDRGFAAQLQCVTHGLPAAHSRTYQREALIS